MKVLEQNDDEFLPPLCPGSSASPLPLLPHRSRLPPIQRRSFPLQENGQRDSAYCPDAVPLPRAAEQPSLRETAQDAPPPSSLAADQRLAEERRIAEQMAAMHIGGGRGDAGTLGAQSYRFSSPPYLPVPCNWGRIAGLDAEPSWFSSSSTWLGNLQNPQASVGQGAFPDALFFQQTSNPPQDDALDRLRLMRRNEHPVSSFVFSNPTNYAHEALRGTGASRLDGRAAAMHGHNAQLLSFSDVEAVGFEDGLILQGRELRCVDRNRRRRSQQNGHHRWSTRSNSSVLNASHMCSSELVWLSFLPLDNNSMVPNKCIYCNAKDQQGCQTLQRMIVSETPHVVDAIFNGIINHVEELAMNPLAHHLLQKLLDVCNEEHRLWIIEMLTGDPIQLVSISVHPHGTRVVQKLIETLRMEQQISLIIAALKPGFLDLTMDAHGNRVINSCLTSFAPEYNAFIFDAAAKYCVRLATDQHGCCILQRCMDHASGVYRERLLLKLSDHGYALALDAFGNYAVQYILRLGSRFVNAKLVTLFKGNYVTMSIQKFSSNVVEKCLEFFVEEDQASIVHELVSVPQFELLLTDQYANYVIHAALLHTKVSAKN
ncbi:hypothetical protein Cni_G08569 [Canna indica]|uniref:PUM-HD domain-containing protein n=1 Tax=Canna indica TaxID=4628 RepID=A0AAQ3K341_9LILI|nr:hypothetical protein Cni_G08569 [Canna indica]